jgi:hypothetical protein
MKKHYTIQEDLRHLFNALEDMKDEISELENKIKRAKIYPQLLNNEMWCDI